jgi:hypothetical protein
MRSVEQRIEAAAATIGMQVVRYCTEINQQTAPRYFHADTRPKDGSRSIWRLKIVNSSRTDCDAVRKCNDYFNKIHPAIATNQALARVVEIPRPFDLPLQEYPNLNCCELIEARAAGLQDLDLIAESLAQIKLRAGSIAREFADSRLNRYGFEQYRERLIYSLEELRESGATTDGSVAKTRSAFELHYPRAAGVQDFAHGDFSFGNLRVRDGRLALIDFEHSHLGLAEVDLAHLFVNLIAGGDRPAAIRLLESFRTQVGARGAGDSEGAFRALELERIVGKMNAMSQRSGAEWARMEALLAERAELAG